MITHVKNDHILLNRKQFFGNILTLDHYYKRQSSGLQHWSVNMLIHESELIYPNLNLI